MFYRCCALGGFSTWSVSQSITDYWENSYVVGSFQGLIILVDDTRYHAWLDFVFVSANDESLLHSLRRKHIGIIISDLTF